MQGSRPRDVPVSLIMLNIQSDIEDYSHAN